MFDACVLNNINQSISINVAAYAAACLVKSVPIGNWRNETGTGKYTALRIFKIMLIFVSQCTEHRNKQEKIR